MSNAVATKIETQEQALTIVDRAIMAGATAEVIGQLIGLRERDDAFHARKAFDNAMADAKAEIPVIFKNRAVDFVGKTGIRTNYRHEDLAGILRVVDPILAKHGLNCRFRTTSLPNEPVTVTCVISHRDGHREENTLSAARDDSGNKNNIQAIGSTQTYLQRYTLKSALGLAASSDDDGKAGGSDPITEAQADEIRDLILKTKSDVDRFLKYIGAASIPDIPAAKFNNAIAALKAKVKP